MSVPMEDLIAQPGLNVIQLPGVIHDVPRYDFGETGQRNVAKWSFD